MLTLTRAENLFFKSFDTPERIQQLLDSLPYRCDSRHLPAIYALRDWQAHCFDGCLLAAAALRRNGIKPYIIDLCAIKDDDHLICAFQQRGFWGAVAKSNFPGLRFREPIFKTPKELVLSYFEFYFNLKGLKTLRMFSKPFPFPSLNKLNWETDSDAIKPLLKLLERFPHYKLLTSFQEQQLSRIDSRLMESQMSGVDLSGAYGGSSYRKQINKKVRKPEFI